METELQISLIGAMRERVPVERRERFRDILSRFVAGPFLTEILLLPDAPQSEALDVLTGHYRSGGRIVQNSSAALTLPGGRPVTVRLRTVDGQAHDLALGPRWFPDPDSGSVSRLARRVQLGESLTEVYRAEPQAEVSVEVGVQLLSSYGVRLGDHAEFDFAGAPARRENDLTGHPVQPRQRWLLYEVGGRFDPDRAKRTTDEEPQPARGRGKG